MRPVLQQCEMMGRGLNHHHQHLKSWVFGFLPCNWSEHTDPTRSTTPPVDNSLEEFRQLPLSSLFLGKKEQKHTVPPVTFWAPQKNLSSQQNVHLRPSAQPLVELKKTQGSHPHSETTDFSIWSFVKLPCKGDRFPPCVYSKGKHRIPQEFKKCLKTNWKNTSHKSISVVWLFSASSLSSQTTRDN